MATFKICVFKHQKRADGKYPVSIRICHLRKYAYLQTGYKVTPVQINKRTFEVKDTFILKDLNERIEKMERIISERLGFEANQYDVRSLTAFIENEMKFGSEVEFVSYGLKVADLKDQKKAGSGRMIRRTVRMVVDYCNGREKIMFKEFDNAFLQGFVDYMRTEHTTTRRQMVGKVKIKRKPASDITIKDYIGDISNIFRRAMMEFNTETTIRISDWSLRRFEFKVTKQSKRRVLTIEDLKKLVFAFGEKEVHGKWSVAQMYAGTAFVASFLFCGINMVDLYHLKKPIAGRIQYKRTKTRDRRPDEAFISIQIPDQAKWIFERFGSRRGLKAFRFDDRYKSNEVFLKNINGHLKKIADILKIDVPLTTYYARHTWASIARNKVGVSKDDIDLALNHVDLSKKMADVYIEPDFSMIDAANKKVIDYVYSLPDPVINHEAETPKS